MNKYMKELQELKPYDEVQFMNEYGAIRGYNKIYTAGHGYLVVPVTDKYAGRAKYICKYGFVGKYAIYLEEDCELPEFIDSLTTVKIQEA